jgi:hypothetical protein
MAGSKSTIQMSPRLGAGTVAIEVILAESLEGGQRRVIPVIRFCKGSGGGQDRVACAAGSFRNSAAVHRRVVGSRFAVAINVPLHDDDATASLSVQPFPSQMVSLALRSTAT